MFNFRGEVKKEAFIFLNKGLLIKEMQK